MILQGEIFAGAEETMWSKLHLFTDDGQVNLMLKGAPQYPRAGETLELGGVIHRVVDVHWTTETPRVPLVSSSSAVVMVAHARLEAIAQGSASPQGLR